MRGLRHPVEMIVGLLASGMTTDEVLADFPDLVADDVLGHHPSSNVEKDRTIFS